MKIVVKLQITKDNCKKYLKRDYGDDSSKVQYMQLLKTNVIKLYADKGI